MREEYGATTGDKVVIVKKFDEGKSVLDASTETSVVSRTVDRKTRLMDQSSSQPRFPVDLACVSSIAPLAIVFQRTSYWSIF